MHYTIRLSAIHGDVVPLSQVAIAKALHDATAGGSPYHHPMLQGRLTEYILDLLEEVQAGRLEVCDGTGRPILIDQSIGATEHFGYEERYVREPDWDQIQREAKHMGAGVYDLTNIDLGPTRPDMACPRIGWHAKLKKINEWAEKRGDSYTIVHEGGWVDERGYIEPSPSEEASPTPSRNAALKQPQERWIQFARTAGLRVAKKHPNLSLDQIAEKVHQELQTAADDGDPVPLGRGGRIPAIGTIRRRALYRLRAHNSVLESQKPGVKGTRSSL